MIEQDCYSLAPELSQFPTSAFPECGCTRRQQHSKRSSTDSNAALRELLKPWGTLPFTPQSCRAISFSSWTRFTASNTSTTPTGELKASTLCKANGLAPTYNPPASEWTYLGADQPVHAEKPGNMRRGGHRRQRSSASWTTVSSASDGGEKTEPIQFRKQEVKIVNTSSQLTNSFKMSAVAGKVPSKRETMMKRLGFEGMNCDELPSAFETDSEDED
ncbi:Nn.00g010530.m01.CDS01 [Neocucurbitaria sp. VM-36]